MVEEKKNKKPEQLQYGVLHEVHHNLSKEIDEFENESRARRTIAELVRPIMEDADLDRRNTAILDVKV
jgi:hypothetical protein